MASKAEFHPATSRHRSAVRSPAPISLACVSWRDLEADVSGWDNLAQNAAEPNPFFESWYLLPALRAFDDRRRIGLIRFAIEGRLAGILPLARRRHYYGWPIPNLTSWLHDNCFLGTPLIERGAERAFWEALLAWADAQPGAGLFLHLGQVALAGPVYDALIDVAATQSRELALVHREERAMLSSDLGPDAYLEAAMSAKKRKELRRQFARLSEAGLLEVERSTDVAALDHWIEHFLALEAAGWKGTAGSALACSAETASLFRQSLIGAGERGKLERLTLSLDGRPIAMLATFLTPPGAFSYKTAFDEDFARFSPGVLLQRENLAILGLADIAWSDSCASADHPMIDHIWRERRAIGRLSIAIGGRLRRAAFHRIARAELGRNPAGCAT